MTTKADELKPCPFCGCSVNMSAVARDWWRVAGDHDDDCILYDQRHDAPQSDDQKQALIEAWNRRAAQPSVPKVQELLDALQEVVDAADGGGWNVLDPSLEKQRAALTAMGKQR